MINRWKRHAHQPARALSNRVIALGAMIGVGAAAFTVPWLRYGGGSDVELDLSREIAAE